MGAGSEEAGGYAGIATGWDLMEECLSSHFCGKCGTPIADPTDTFCRRCGASVSVPPVISPEIPTSAPWPVNATLNDGAPARTAAPFSPAIAYRRPWWPWVLVAAGILLLVVFGGQAFYANAVVQRIEASGAVTAAKSASWLGKLLGLGSIGEVIDPRNQQAYIQARQVLASSSIVASFGLFLAVLGLFLAAVLQPSLRVVDGRFPAVPRSGKPVVGRVELLAAGWVSLVFALMSVPNAMAFELSWVLAPVPAALTTLSEGIFGLVGYVYPLWQFKRLLNTGWGIRSADGALKWLIGIMLVVYTIGMVTGAIMVVAPVPSVPPDKSLTLTALLGALPVVAVGVWLGVKLLDLTAGLYGLGKPLAYSVIIGALSSILAIFPAGSVISSVFAAATSAILGLVLLKAAASISGPSAEGNVGSANVQTT